MRSGLPDRLPPPQYDWLGRLAELRRRAVAAIRGAWSWLFGGPPSGWPWSWLLAALLAVVVGGSTATASWVPGSDLVGVLALAGALAGGVLALVRRLPWPVGLLLLLAIGLPVAAQRVGADQLRLGLAATLSGDPGHAGGLLLFGVGLLLWAIGAWMAWCVLRWRQPLLGLVPGVATFATNLLNFPADQNAYLLELAGLTLVLLLWTAYRRSLDHAVRRGLRLTPDSRWDFWESGAVAAIGLLVVAFFAPPLSTVDRTVDAQSGLIKAWSDIQIRLHHALPSASRQSSLSTGFSDQVSLGRPLTRDKTVVFTYKPLGSHSTTLYFEGLSVAATVNGEWRFGPELAGQDLLPANQSPDYAEQYASRGVVKVSVRMQRPPASAPAVFFHPGQLVSLSRPAVVTAEPPEASVLLIDRAQSLSPTTGGTYTVTGSYSVAPADLLRAAGTGYPDWVLPYAQLNFWGNQANQQPTPYRAPDVEQQIKALAAQVTKGTTNPYDAAVAIETYLRSASFKYTLSPPRTPAGQDPLAYFLFQSKQGYCEYFASAMGDMLRSLGIPVRLVNGYGPGTWDAKAGNFVVRESDAHTWVETYFPKYGWVPFEPTPDGTYQPVPRGAVQCSANVAICTAAAAVAAVAGDKLNAPGFKDEQVAGGEVASAARSGRSQVPFEVWPGLLLVPALLVVIGLVLAIRFLTPRSAGRAWRRTQLLSRLAGVPAGPGETPLEFGRRLALLLPGAAEAAQAISQAFTRAAYGPPELAPQAADDVLASWQALRPALLREAAARAARRR